MGDACTKKSYQALRKFINLDVDRIFGRNLVFVRIEDGTQPPHSESSSFGSCHAAVPASIWALQGYLAHKKHPPP